MTAPFFRPNAKPDASTINKDESAEDQLTKLLMSLRLPSL